MRHLFIMGVVALIVGFVCAMIMLIFPKGLLCELFRIVAIVGGAIGSLYVGASLWGYGF